MNPTVLNSTHADYPARLRERLGEHAPKILTALGAVASLSQPKTALFCSVRCPGDAILGAYDTARKLRDEGVTVVSGFHSPVEKECLRILLRGKQPIIICLARSLEKIRVPVAWRGGLDTGRLLLLSPFEKRPRRPDTKSAQRRNEVVAALSDEVLIIHAEPGGSIERITKSVDRWSIPRTRFGISPRLEATMPRLKENKARERRIEMEAVVDAYNSEERAMGWYYYLEERLKFPFKARRTSKREISPLRVGEDVDVIGMAPEEECASEMFVRVRWCDRKLAVPLSQLKPREVDATTREAVRDWHYWVARGYQF